MGADLPRAVLVVSEVWRAAAVGPGVRGTPDGGLAMPVATGVLYLDMCVSLWGLPCGVWEEGLVRARSYSVVFTHVDGGVPTGNEWWVGR